MQHLLTPYTKQIEKFAWWDEGFTEQELNWLQQKTKEAVEEAYIGKVNNEMKKDTNVRSTKLNWIFIEPNNAWVFDKLSHIVSSINAEHFGFELTGFGEPIQLSHYDETQQSHYKWHVDFGSSGPSRKLSIVLQLSDPADYEGGQLQLFTNSDVTNIPKKRGLITIFPSYTLHQVTPVIKGTRQTLVSWISGPPFK